MSSFDVAIAGGGIMGTATAYYLSKKGFRVVVLEQDELPNEWAGSNDHVKIMQFSFGKDLFYSDLAARSLILWRDFQKEAREEFFQETGVLDLSDKDKAYGEACFQSLNQLKVPVYRLDPAEVQDRFRIFNTHAARYAVFHPGGGMLWAQRALAAFVKAATRQRTVVHTKSRVVRVVKGKDGIQELRDGRGKAWRAGTYVFAAGSWTKEILSAFRLPLTVNRQQLLYFRPPLNQGRFRPGHCPVLLCRGYYLLPVHIHGFMKIGELRKGPSGKPGSGVQKTSPQFERACRDFLKRFIPDLYGFTESEGKVYYCNNTPDGDFIVDRLPNCPNGIVAAGFGTGGFQFAPFIGSALTDLISTGKTEVNLGRFRLGRFGSRR